VDEGAAVSQGDPMAEVSTDKVDTQLEAPASGVIVRYLVQPGTEVKIGASVALLANPDATGEEIVEALAAFDAGTLQPPVSAA
jgi:pyruvate/2-oxoglutarate dehydrogenase complex dihydrolipoamide acyltransferase (E2) component